jgi:uncharacterized membrane protein
MGVNLGELTGNGAVGIDALFVAAMVAAFFALTTAAYAPTRGRRALAACTAVAGFVVLEAVWSAWRDLDLWISQQNVSSSHPAGLAVATAGGITILLGALIAALTPGQRSVGPASDRRPGP